MTEVEAYYEENNPSYWEINNDADFDFCKEDLVRFAKNYADLREAEVIDDIIKKAESIKGLSGKMAIGSWSKVFVEMLKKLKKERQEG